MKTLYISDLDGTLLRSDRRTSEFTNQTINELVEQGMLFSYATARSYISSRPVTEGLDAKIPVILYNGVMTIDNADGSIIFINYLPDCVHDLLDDLIAHDIYPIVYSMQNGIERMSYVEDKRSDGMKRFHDLCGEDKRKYPVKEAKQLHDGEIFYFTCIDEYEKLEPFYKKYMDQYQCLFLRDIYTDDQWLDFLPKGTSKASAIKHLKEYYQCDRVIAFGDGLNDIEMFQMADEAYAVENAVPELKAIATGIIDGNYHDGVAKWLKENFKTT